MKNYYADANKDNGTIIKKVRWEWTDRTCPTKSPSVNNNNNSALAPGGKRGWRRPRTSWTRTAESELKAMQQPWGSITKLAQIGKGEGSLLLPDTPGV